MINAFGQIRLNNTDIDVINGRLVVNSQILAVSGENLGNFISTGDADNRYLTTGVSGNFYGSNNPNNYIALSNLQGLANSGDFVSGVSVTGGLAIRGALNINAGANVTLTQQGLNTFQISAAAGSTNIEGLISTGDADLRYLTSGVSGEFLKNSNLNGLISTGSADTRYYSVSNPNNFSNSGNIENTGTALQNQLGNYYLNTNPNNFSSSGNVQNTGTTLVGLINNLKPFSRGGTVINDTGISTGNFIVWRSQFPCTVTGIYGYRVGGTNVSFSARRNGSSNHLSVPSLLASPDTWTNGGTVTNTAYVAGDKLEIMVVAVTGGVTQVAVQVDFLKT